MPRGFLFDASDDVPVLVLAGLQHAALFSPTPNDATERGWVGFQVLGETGFLVDTFYNLSFLSV